MLAPIGILAGVVALAAVAMLRDTPNEMLSTLPGGPAPPLTGAQLGDLPGVTPELLASGEVTLVNFWASWCPPCRAEHPRLLGMAAGGLRIIGVNFRDTESAASNYLDADGNPFVAVAFDPTGGSASAWGVTAPPVTFILDGDGTVLFRFGGPLVGSDYENRFMPALRDALARK